MTQDSIYDLCVIGGGINGVGIAADAAGRGLSVYLCEQNDLASATSQYSSKLIHGGLRYLEHYEFGLVKSALTEREIILKSAPHLVFPIRFVMPHVRDLRPAWLIRIGLFLYDILGKNNSLPRCQSIDFTKEEENPLNLSIRKGFAYSDCATDDARLVVTLAILATEHGANIQTRTKFIGATRHADHWEVTLEQSGRQTTIRAKSIVNVAGPWADEVLGTTLQRATSNRLQLVKGSHIVVPRTYEGKHAYILQHRDQRVIFVIPYQKQYTLIGTTDVLHHDAPETAEASQEEIDYLCEAYNRYFHESIKAEDVVWHYAGVRPLLSQPGTKASAITRDYSFQMNTDEGKAPLLSIFGGKLTTYRKLAEDALSRLQPFFPNMKPRWTHECTLPGGDLPNGSCDDYIGLLKHDYPWAHPNMLKRYARQYGSRSKLILEGANALQDMGEHFGGHFYEREVQYLMTHEWAQTIDDLLWRRTKLGLNLSPSEVTKLETYLQGVQTLAS